MFGSHFYHSTVRKSVAVFGTLFNNITVARKKGDGSLINQVKVPLAYGPRQKFLSRLDSETGQDASIAIKLPRMAFEITSIELDTSKKLQKRSRISEQTSSSVSTSRTSIQHQVPYNINMQLNIMAKNQDDGLQILEQILPYFQPEYTLSIKPVDALTSFKQDVPIILSGVSFEDQYEGDYNSRRVLIYTLDFTMKMSFYGPTDTPKLIREVDVNISENADPVVAKIASTFHNFNYTIPSGFVVGATLFQGNSDNPSFTGTIKKISTESVQAGKGSTITVNITLNEGDTTGFVTNAVANNANSDGTNNTTSGTANLKVQLEDGSTQTIPANASGITTIETQRPSLIETIEVKVGDSDTANAYTVTTTIDITNF